MSYDTMPNFKSKFCIVSSMCFDSRICLNQKLSTFRKAYDDNVFDGHNFCDKRKAEFLAGRLCVRQAIRKLLDNDKYDEVVLMNADRTPRWPNGIVGSITHTCGLAGAAVGNSREFLSIGIDYETILSMQKSRDLKGAILNSSEAIRFAYFDQLEFNILCTLIFSIKESVFKCIYQMIRKHFEISLIDVTDIDIVANSFKFRFLCTIPAIVEHAMCFCYFCITDRYVCTLVEMKRKCNADENNF